MNGEMTIAILGGMGTYATIHAFEQYAAIFPAVREWDRPRLIVDNRCTMPSRVRAFLYQERVEELVTDMSESLRNLCAMGGPNTRIILACNTSHLFLPRIYEQYPELEEHIVNIIQATAHAVRDHGGQSVYLLGTEATIESGVFRQPLEDAGVSYTAPSQEIYPVLRDCIEAVKQNKYTEETRSEFISLMQGHDDVILGCTELPILYKRYRDELPQCRVYDPVEEALLRIREEYEKSRA